MLTTNTYSYRHDKILSTDHRIHKTFKKNGIVKKTLWLSIMFSQYRIFIPTVENKVLVTVTDEP